MSSNYWVEDSSAQIIQNFLFIIEIYTEDRGYDCVNYDIVSISIVPASVGGALQIACV